MKEKMKEFVKCVTCVLFIICVIPVVLTVNVLLPMSRLMLALVYALFGDRVSSSEMLDGVMIDVDSKV